MLYKLVNNPHTSRVPIWDIHHSFAKDADPQVSQRAIDPPLDPLVHQVHEGTTLDGEGTLGLGFPRAGRRTCWLLRMGFVGKFHAGKPWVFPTHLLHGAGIFAYIWVIF